MLHSIDYHITTGNCIFQQSPDAAIPANHTRLLASDWAHLDVWEEVPAVTEEREVPGTIDLATGEVLTPATTETVELVPASRRLLKQGVVVKYEQERDALPRPEPVPVPVPEPVPQAVSNQQLRLALIDAGIMPSAILAQLQAMPAGAAKEKALAAWEYANEFRRDHPLVAALSAQLGLTSAQVDGLFRAAATLG